MDDLLRIARSQEAIDHQLKQYGTEQGNNQLTDKVNAVGDKSDGNMHSGKGNKCFSCNQEDISVETGSVQRVTELAECAVLLAISKLNVPELISVVVVALDPEGIKVAEVLMVEEGILGVDKVMVKEEVVMVMEGHKKQTLWLTGLRNHSKEATSPVQQSRICIYCGAVNWP